MPRLAYLAATCLTGLAITTPAQAAAPDPVAIAAAMFPNSPCSGQSIATFSDQMIKEHDEEASINDLSRYSLSCTIVFNAKNYLSLTPMKRCATRVHAEGHLAGLQDNDPNFPIMGAHAAHEYFALCATVRDKVRHQLESKPHVFWASCGKQHGTLMICRAEREGTRGVLRYRVRVNGEQFSLRRI